MSSFSWEGHDALSRKLARLADPDASPLMETWERIIVEDNRRGVLSGQDKDGNPAPPLRYRSGSVKPTRGRHKGPKFGSVHHPNNPGQAGNLTSSQYRKLTGPRLAPRGERSRVITNLFTEHGRDPLNGHYQWYAVGAWDRVVSQKGVPFLRFHFEGLGRNPRYDLRGVRPQGMRDAREALHEWVDDLLS